MNYLAHAYLSMNKPGILTGNMISDFVKGKKIFDYPSIILKGIRLHRSIDAFTDSHPATKEINRFFHPHYRLYAAAFTDIVYDFFLANDHNEFPDPGKLKNFSAVVYNELEKDKTWMPDQFRRIFPFMKSQDWLYNYRHDEGMQKSFLGLARRAKYIDETETAFKIFMYHKEKIKPYYDQFFPALKQYSVRTLEDLLHSD